MRIRCSRAPISRSLSVFLAVVLTVSFLGFPPTHNVSAAAFPIQESFANASAPGWVLGGSSVLTGNGSTDPVGAGWLRLTNIGASSGGYAYYDTAFPSTKGIVVSFDYAIWGGTGADGLAFFLFDGATASVNTGAFGGSLGYAQSCTNPGVTNGYVGIGFDEYGAFADVTCHTGGSSGLRPGVTLRGSGNGTTGYTYLTNVPRSDIQGVRSNYRSVMITISPDKHISVQVRFGPSSSYTTLISNYDLSTASGQTPLPATLKLGFIASVGGMNNYHEIRNVSVTQPVNLSVTNSDGRVQAAPGDALSYTVTVTNQGPNDITGAAFSDTVSAALTNVNWTCSAPAGSACGAASGSGSTVDTTVSLLNGASATFTIQGTVAASPTVTLQNSATITLSAEYTDTNPSDNTAVDADNLPPTITSFSKAAGEDSPIAFSAVDFTGHYNDVDGNSL
ncbi:MAG TPA: hypothetical protein VHO48_13120, partial [Anaerolineaceae bacterium]|nr:hypothetical protein [Anaerolineaceae bacterium]